MPCLLLRCSTQHPQPRKCARTHTIPHTCTQLHTHAHRRLTRIQTHTHKPSCTCTRTRTCTCTHAHDTQNAQTGNLTHTHPHAGDQPEARAAIKDWSQQHGLDKKPMYMFGISAGASFVIKFPNREVPMAGLISGAYRKLYRCTLHRCTAAPLHAAPLPLHRCTLHRCTSGCGRGCVGTLVALCRWAQACVLLPPRAGGQRGQACLLAVQGWSAGNGGCWDACGSYRQLRSTAACIGLVKRTVMRALTSRQQVHTSTTLMARPTESVLTIQLLCM